MEFLNVAIVREFAPCDTVDYLLRALFEGVFSRKIYLNNSTLGDMYGDGEKGCRWEN